MQSLIFREPKRGMGPLGFIWGQRSRQPGRKELSQELRWVLSGVSRFQDTVGIVPLVGQKALPSTSRNALRRLPLKSFPFLCSLLR